MKLTENFHIDEFKCKDGTGVPDEYFETVKTLAEQLQKIRDHFDKPVRIISGYRSPKYNSRIGGAKRSQHMLATAADIVVSGVDSVEVWRAVKDMIADGTLLKGGVGLYESFVHYDIRGRNARWYGTGMRKYKN
jgi:uncharacterized protein YcbK (DUF882 family)